MSKTIQYIASALVLFALLIVGCASSNQREAGVAAQESPPRTALPTLTTAIAPTAQPEPLQPVSPAAVTVADRGTEAATRLYLASFDGYRLRVIDPTSGHAIYERELKAQQPGLAVAPDGRRVYILDGVGQAGELSVLDTRTWQAIVQVTVPEMALLLAGNPLSLSGDGRWLLVQHFSYNGNRAWTTLFDTSRNLMLDKNPLDRFICSRTVSLPQLVGRPVHPRLYLQCDAEIMALDAETLSPVWRMLAPDTRPSALALSKDGRILYGIYPSGNVGCFGDNANDLVLYEWNSEDGSPVRQTRLSEQVHVPEATCGRGGRVYMLSGPATGRLYIAWEDRLWVLSPDTGRVTGTLILPSAIDRFVSSVDGRELYLLPATAGDLQVHERGMYAVDAEQLVLLRHMSDWPELISPIIFAAQVPP